MEEMAARRKRINRLKKMILAVVGLAIVIPVIISVFLGVKVVRLQSELNELKALLDIKGEETEEVTGVYTTAYIEESPREKEKEILTAENTDQELSRYDKRIYLTFDDGPSSSTDAILDILKENDIKATFFVLGKTDEKSRKAYQRIVAEGHTLGMHSYSHKYNEIYESKESFVKDLTALQEYLYEVTGVWSRYYRFPGGSSNTVSKVDMQELITYLNESGITYFDWNAASGDAVSGQLPKDTILNNCMSKIEAYSDCMILMHDAAEKKTTVEALPELIKQVKERGDACFLPVTDDTVPIQHIKAHNN